MMRLPAAAIELNYGNLLRPLTAAACPAHRAVTPSYRPESEAMAPLEPRTARREKRLCAASSAPQ